MNDINPALPHSAISEIFYTSSGCNVVSVAPASSRYLDKQDACVTGDWLRQCRRRSQNQFYILNSKFPIN
ncbi:hypothetical protein NWP17_05170 [Chrysosporum bergii ANA360D]|uniref:Uncharacterized protein n=1 Tax=Chrysosporum bergii ANA360D TaxID=617107 RepID=A0AA43KB10_9CYAN|nr:hypothetical protein [Chrysosporum bergii]MDH6059832.1 hypothetical protein [Chrysosporum bergii ANA360D]